MNLTLRSTAFRDGIDIPSKYTCDGDDVSPALEWENLPPNTQSLALIVDDPDAPDPAAPQRVWKHWILYDIPPTATGLAEAVKPEDLPVGTKQGLNDWQRTGYGGPCPPTGKHRYFFKLYALDIVLPDLGTPDKSRLEKAMHGHVIAETEIIGRYQRT